MNFKHKFLMSIATFLLSIMFFISGCESTNDPSDTGTLLVKVTDAPFPIDFVEKASVTVNKIEVRKKDDTNENPFITVFEEEIVFDLLQLRNGITSDLPEIEIPTGSYDLVRLYVQSADIKINGGEEFNLNVPSGDETGIKLFIKPELIIQGGLTAELLLDFDLNNSFIAQGDLSSPDGINGFNFKPVIRAVNNSLAGSVYGNVTAAEDGANLESVLITVEVDGESATARTDKNGYFEVLGLKEGNYSATAFLDGYVNGEDNFAITANNKTEVNFELNK